MRIVFMGTPGFAVPSLRRLMESSHKIAGVVTQPDRPRGRGLRLSPSPVKEEAQRNDLPLLQPDDVSDSEFIRSLRSWKADLFVVVGYRILPPDVFEIPEKGTVNLHASLLPKYRGAAPVQWALIRGEKNTGLTTFFIDRKVDTGNWIMQKKVSILPMETAGELHDRLSIIGADLLVNTIDSIAEGTAQSKPQKGEISSAPKIRPAHCRIDWTQSARNITNLIRGLSPNPGAFCRWGDRTLKLYKARVLTDTDAESRPGTVYWTGKEGIDIVTGRGILRVGECQLEGKRRLSAMAFLCGCSMEPGLKLE
ncbi:MAG TPA: methionyl-tRNA formyltransferase [bacterium]|nr:methionyl-tRNA formyltransferase [bacterium]